MVDDLQHEITAWGALELVSWVQVGEVPVGQLDQMIEGQRLREAPKLGAVGRTDQLVELTPDPCLLSSRVERYRNLSHSSASLVVAMED
jgi:hypothetical protein